MIFSINTANIPNIYAHRFQK